MFFVEFSSVYLTSMECVFFVHESSFPHGGWVSMGLIVSCMAALSATMYGMSSCQFLYVDFVSDRGDFGTFYLDESKDGDPIKYRAGAGLFSWLLPYEASDWSKGKCVGYIDLQLEVFGDTVFELSRIFGVLCVLGGIVITSWTLFLSCFALTKLQSWSMNLMLFGLGCFVGLTFFDFQSQLCQDLLSKQDETTECTLDKGGLVTVAACMFWCVAFFISVFHVKPPESDATILPDADERQQQPDRLKVEGQNGLDRAKSHRDTEASSPSRWPRFGSRGQPVQPAQSSSSLPQISCYEDDGVLEVELHLEGRRVS